MASKSMTKSEIVKTIATKTNLSSKQVNEVFAQLKKLTLEQVKKNGEFRLIDLGKVKLVHKKARKVRNPKTGSMINVPAKNVVKFSFTKDVKTSVK